MLDLESKRLKFRPLVEEDFPFIFSLFNNPLAMKYYPGLRNEEQTKKWIQFFIAQQTALGFSKRLILIKDSLTPIGHCGLVPTDVDGESEIELGYFLHPDYWGHGFATEAANAVLHDAKENLHLRRVISAINPDNSPSVEVAKRLGMKKEKVGMAYVPGFTWKAEIWAIDLSERH